MASTRGPGPLRGRAHPALGDRQASPAVALEGFARHNEDGCASPPRAKLSPALEAGLSWWPSSSAFGRRTSVLVHGKGRDSGMLCDVDDEDAGMRWRRLLAREIPFMPMRRDIGAERCMRVVSILGRACNRFPPGERLDGRIANRLIDAHKDEKVDNGMNLNPYRMLIKRKRQICEENKKRISILFVCVNQNFSK